MPKKYEENYYNNKRLIFLSKIGQLVSSPFQNDIDLAPSEREDLIYELIESHIGSDGMRALKGKSSINIILNPVSTNFIFTFLYSLSTLIIPFQKNIKSW